MAQKVTHSEEYKTLLDVILSGQYFNKEQGSMYKQLPQEEKEAFNKEVAANQTQIMNSKINREFKRVFNKLQVSNPEAAENIAKIAKFTDDESFNQHFADNTNYKLNEVMVAVIQDEDTPEDIKDIVKERLYTKNVGLIGSILRKYANPDDGKMTMEDLGQEAKRALFEKIIPTYDISHGSRFSTYATTIFHNVVVGSYTAKVNKYRSKEISMETKIDGGDGSPKELLDFQEDPHPNPEELWRREAEDEVLYEILNKLTPEQKFVAYCRFGLGGKTKKTQSEIAEYMHMSQANVSKIENAMLARMKTFLRNTGVF